MEDTSRRASDGSSARSKNSTISVTMVPIGCEEIVLRALLKKNWFHEETHRIKADAFIRDPRRDPDGLSVAPQSKTVLDAWLGTFRSCFGADSLHSGKIRQVEMGVDVAQAEDEFQFGFVPCPDPRAAMQR
jgi:hypothetical protein